VLEHLRETNQDLDEARQNLQAVFDSVGVGIMVVDADMHIVSFNRKMREWFDIDDSAIGKSCRGVVCDGAQPRNGCIFHDVMVSRRGERCGDTVLGDRHYQAMAAPIKNARGEIDRVIIVYADITDRKRMEDVLRQALTEVQSGRERIDAIVRSIGDGVVVTDTEDRVVLINPAAEEFFKVSLVGKNIHDVGSLFEDQRLYQNLVSALTSSETGDFHRTPATGEGEKSRVLQGRSSVIRDLDGRERGHVLTLRDLTREREVERLKREFVSNAGHELQTPLTAIIGFSELLIGQEELPEETRQECLRFINEKGEELSAIVDNLLDINRIASGCRLQLHPEKCDLRRLASEVLEPFRSKFIKHDFVLDFPPESLLYRVDPQKLKKVLEGLLSNAVKFSPEGGKVRLLCKRLGDGFELSISDEGIGMAPEQVQRMFEVFYRGHTSNPAFSGPGLGLAIVKEMVDAHGGKIWVDSQPGQGTSFHVKIPLLDNSDAWSPPFRV
jgi:PAS domain S-box-containing protein